MSRARLRHQPPIPREELPTLPEIPPMTSHSSGARAAVRPETEAMTSEASELEAVTEECRESKRKLEEGLAPIDAMLKSYVEDIDEDEEPTKVRRVVVELKRKLGAAPGAVSSRRR